MGNVVNLPVDDDEKWLKTECTRLFDPTFLGSVECSKIDLCKSENEIHAILYRKLLANEFDRVHYNLQNLKNVTPGNTDLFEAQSILFAVLRKNDNKHSIHSARFRQKLRLLQLTDIYYPINAFRDNNDVLLFSKKSIGSFSSLQYLNLIS